MQVVDLICKDLPPLPRTLSLELYPSPAEAAAAAAAAGEPLPAPQVQIHAPPPKRGPVGTPSSGDSLVSPLGSLTLKPVPGMSALLVSPTSGPQARLSPRSVSPRSLYGEDPDLRGPVSPRVPNQGPQTLAPMASPRDGAAGTGVRAVTPSTVDSEHGRSVGGDRSDSISPLPQVDPNLLRRAAQDFRNVYITLCERLGGVAVNADLVRAMQSSSTANLMKISICHSTVDDAHTVALAGALRAHPFLAEIVLNHNAIGDIVCLLFSSGCTFDYCFSLGCCACRVRVQWPKC